MGALALRAGRSDLSTRAGVELGARVRMGWNGGSISERVPNRHEIVMQGTSAELLADEWHLTREELDAYSLESHRRATAASDAGKFEREIIPIQLPGASNSLLQAAGAAPTAPPHAKKRLLQAE